MVRCLNPGDHNPRRITQADKHFAKTLDLKFPVKIRDIHKIEKNNSIGISVFGYENKKNIQSMYQNNVKKNMLTYYWWEKEKKTLCSLHRGRKSFCRYCLHAFITEEILKRHIKDCFKSNGKQRIIMPKKCEYVKFKNFERKIKSPFMIYVGFEFILVP